MLIVLLAGGDYHDGMPGCGLVIAHGLARCGFGDRLLLEFERMRRDDFFGYLYHTWADDVSAELRSNSRGFLHLRQPQLAVQLAPFLTTLDREIVEGYICPQTTSSKPINDLACWTWQAPDVTRIADFCFTHLGWTEITKLVPMFRRNLWEGVIYRMLLSVSQSCGQHQGEQITIANFIQAKCVFLFSNICIARWQKPYHHCY